MIYFVGIYDYQPRNIKRMRLQKEHLDASSFISNPHPAPAAIFKACVWYAPTESQVEVLFFLF